MKASPYMKLIANRSAGSGYLIIANSEEELKKQIEEDGVPLHCLEVRFPIPNVKHFNLTTKTFSGLLDIIALRLPFENAQVKSVFADVTKEADALAAKSITSNPIKAAKAPEKSATGVSGLGEIVDMSKEKIEPIITSEEVPIPYQFGSFQHQTIDMVPNNHEAWFIGSYIKSQKEGENGYYIILTTPNEDFEKQMPIVFKKERAAIFVYSALLQHPGFQKIVNSMAPFPVGNLAKEDQVATKCIYVADGLRFIQSL